MYIKQVLNNNVVIALDNLNNEIIVVARGIGFKNKNNSIIDENAYYDLKRYAITFYIKENTIDTYHAIETLNNEKISFDGDRKTVKIDILQYVSCLLSQNYFDNCINNCEFETKCFDKGNELFEEEQYIRKIKGGAA